MCPKKASINGHLKRGAVREQGVFIEKGPFFRGPPPPIPRRHPPGPRPPPTLGFSVENPTAEPTLPQPPNPLIARPLYREKKAPFR